MQKMAPHMSKEFTALYAMYSGHLTAIKRPRGARVNMSLVLERKGKLSGAVNTYVGNTLMNTIKTIGSIAVALQESPATVWSRVVTREINLYISGDDKVVAMHEAIARKVARETGYWSTTGYLRKTMGLEEPLKVIDVFEELEFCSHTPIQVNFTVGVAGRRTNVSRWMPIRPQNELFAKCVYSVGFFFELRDAGGARSADAQLLSAICLFQRRPQGNKVPYGNIAKEHGAAVQAGKTTRIG
jgi:hypothetical protein